MLMGHPPPIIARGQGAMAVIRRVDGKKDARSVEGVHLKEGVSKVLICYPQYEDERQRNSNTRECFHGSSKQLLRSSRRKVSPVELIDGPFLMRHEHLAGALVELRQIGKASSSADGVLHHPPEAVDGIEMVATMGRQDMEAKLILIVVEGRVKLMRPMNATAVDDHDA